MLWYEALDEQVEQVLPDLELVKDEPMRLHTSFRIGGPARRMAFPKSGAQVVLLCALAEEAGVAPLVIGNGTNLLVADRGLDTLVVDLSRHCNAIRVLEDGVLEAEAGALLAHLAEQARLESLTGLEFAHGIPGTVGGAVCMNAGAYDGEMRQVVTEVKALFPDGVRTLTGDELDFGYRHSIFSQHPEAVVLSARMRLRAGDSVAIRERMDELRQKRRKSQPLEWASAGSTFKRPEGNFAGTLIDQCGLKGFTVGGAQVSEKHAGFVINRGGATCGDVLAVIESVQETVYQKTGVRLEPEVKIVT